MKTERKVRVGLTVLIEKATDSLFTNGIRQNVITLRDVYEKCRNVESAYIINTAPNVEIREDVDGPWKKYAKHIISIEEAKEKCDLIVIGQGSIARDKYREFKSLGKKMVKQIMGAELSVFNETLLFKPDSESRNIYLRNSGTVSAVWLSPHFFDRDRYLFEAQYDCETHIGPYIWDPRFIEEHVKLLNQKDPKDFPGTYKPSGSKQKRISTMEPNINMVKTSIVPIITTELFYRKYPHLLDKLNVFCGENLRKKPDMVTFAKELDSYKAQKMFFEARYPMVWTLQKHTDIVLSHQNQCELNYVYLDASWLGYPVIHNSPFMKELGWYYPENDSIKAVEHLAYVAENFDDNQYVNEEYLKKSRAFAYRYMVDNPENIRGYERLIQLAMDSKI
jgi:hypothetical protein